MEDFDIEEANRREIASQKRWHRRFLFVWGVALGAWLYPNSWPWELAFILWLVSGIGLLFLEEPKSSQDKNMNIFR